MTFTKLAESVKAGAELHIESGVVRGKFKTVFWCGHCEVGPKVFAKLQELQKQTPGFAPEEERAA